MRTSQFKNDTLNGSDPKESLKQEITDGTATWNMEFSEDFTGVDVDAEPESIFILDGEYTVQKADGNNKCLSLPGSPMGDFGLLFDRGKGKSCWN